MRKIYLTAVIFCFLAFMNLLLGFPLLKNSDEFVMMEDLSIGVEAGDENLMFGIVNDIDLDAEGNIYALDVRNYRIQKFDNKGSFLQSVTIKKGEGPQEVPRINTMAVTEKGKIYLLGGNGIKILLFDEHGEFLRFFKLDYQAIHIAPYVEEKAVVLGIKDNHIFHVFSEEGEHLDSFGEPFEIPSRYSQYKDLAPLKFPMRMDGSGDGKIFVLNPHRYEINIYEKNKLVGLLKGKNKAFESLMITRSDPQGIGIIFPTASALEHKERVYVTFRTVLNREVPNQLDIFEKGVPIASLDVDGFAYAIDREGRLYFVEEEDFPKVVRYTPKKKTS